MVQFIERSLNNTKYLFRRSIEHLSTNNNILKNKSRKAVYIYVMFSPVFMFYSYNIDKQRMYYLLSSQAQSLSALIGIVFLSITILSELASNYSYRNIENVVGYWVLYYLIPYIFGVFIPMLLLYTGFSAYMASISLFIGGLCIVLLIPFVFEIKKRISVKYDIIDISYEIDKKISEIKHSENKEAKIGDIVDDETTLLYISVSLLDRKNYELFDIAMDNFSVSVNKMLEKISEMDIELQEKLKERIEPIFLGISRIFRANLNDPRAPFVTANTLRKIASNAISRQEEGVSNRCLRSLGDVGLYARSELPVGGLPVAIVEQIFKIADHADRSNMYTISSNAISTVEKVATSGYPTEPGRNASFLQSVVEEARFTAARTLADGWDLHSLSRKPSLVRQIETLLGSLDNELYGTAVRLSVGNAYRELSLTIIKLHEDMNSSLEEWEIEFVNTSANINIERARELKNIGTTEKKIEAVKTLIYEVQNCEGAGLVEKAEEAFEEIEQIVKDIVEDAGPRSPIWEIGSTLGYAVESCVRLDREIGKRSVDLLIMLKEKAEENSVELKGIEKAYQNVSDEIVKRSKNNY